MKENTESSKPSVPDSSLGETSISIEVSARQVYRYLGLGILVLVILGTLANLIIYQVAPDPEHRLARLMHRIDLGFEPSLPAWCSSLVLLLNSLLLCLIGLDRRRDARAPYRNRWFWLSGIFLFLALDEAIMIHEMMSAPLQEFLGLTGWLYLAWTIPASILVLCFLLWNLGFLTSLPAKTKRLFFLSGAIFVTGALGMEVIASSILSSPAQEALGLASIQHTFVQAVEEGLEMFGSALFCYALLDYLASNVREIHLRLS